MDAKGCGGVREMVNGFSQVPRRFFVEGMLGGRFLSRITILSKACVLNVNSELSAAVNFRIWPWFNRWYGARIHGKRSPHTAWGRSVGSVSP